MTSDTSPPSGPVTLAEIEEQIMRIRQLTSSRKRPPARPPLWDHPFWKKS